MSDQEAQSYEKSNFTLAGSGRGKKEKSISLLYEVKEIKRDIASPSQFDTVNDNRFMR
jgi:hypothetical protein